MQITVCDCLRFSFFWEFWIEEKCKYLEYKRTTFSLIFNILKDSTSFVYELGAFNQEILVKTFN